MKFPKQLCLLKERLAVEIEHCKVSSIAGSVGEVATNLPRVVVLGECAFLGCQSPYTTVDATKKVMLERHFFING